MTSKSFTFTHAIVRYPSHSSVNGLRAIDTGAPDFEVFQQHHQRYIDALKSAGATLIALEAQEEYPDSVFVEDTALCLREGAVIMRPGAPTRQGETQLIQPALTDLYGEVANITGPGSVEGGDILVTEKEILVGLSARTNRQGVEALTTIVSQWGYKVRVVQTPPDILHFKTDCSLLDEDTVLCTPALAATGCFDGYRVINTTPGESACANTIRFNDIILMPEGFPATADKLTSAGYNVVCIGNSEAAKIDGGMSCMSLRFSPPV